MDSRSRLLLQQLGIPVWVSQLATTHPIDQPDQLWNERASPEQLETVPSVSLHPVEAVLATPITHLEQAMVLVDSALVQQTELIAEPVAADKKTIEASEVIETEQPATETTVTKVLSLQLYQGSGHFAHCLFLIDVSAMHNPELTTLWHNITKAFSANLRDQLDWPFSAHPIWAAAIEPELIMQGFLSQVSGGQTLLIIGKLPVTLPALAHITVFNAPSLSEMNQDSTAKRILWDYMKSIQSN